MGVGPNGYFASLEEGAAFSTGAVTAVEAPAVSGAGWVSATDAGFSSEVG